MHILITGASGMIGSLVLRECLADPRVTRVTSMVRRASGIVAEKLHEIIVEDFAALDGHRTTLREVDVVFYCIGAYTGVVSRAELYHVTVELPEALARIVIQESPQATFCLLSGEGADRTERSRFSFVRDKGIIENRLAAIGFARFHAIRPAYIYAAYPRREPSWWYRVMRWCYPLIRLFGKRASITSVELARAMLRVGVEGWGSEVVGNRDLVRLGRGWGVATTKGP